ncbi:hypothetical protein [Hydrogenophaga sp.]|uniref:hypothetical protein n=1 Tax=Hydrogenophaga sp. TaxID=1904254 RepID=UPI002731C94D|nr:hypothetical protein [Hydrogenophaga sp.]MDP2017010.1 hypothetical protein [Hydrogenophaga sp.]
MDFLGDGTGLAAPLLGEGHQAGAARNPQSALAQDHATMLPMFMSAPPPFAELMLVLTETEHHLNRQFKAEPNAR